MDLGVFTGSDHNAIRFTIQDAGPAATRRTAPPPEGWAVKKLNDEILAAYIRRIKVERAEDWLGTDPDEAAERFHHYVRAGCCLSMPRRGSAGGHRPAYWWNDDIAQKRRLCIEKRRAYRRRGRRSQQRDEERHEYNKAKKDLRMAIRRSQEKAWSELIDSVEEDVWGTPYRLVTKKLTRHPRDAHTRGRELEIAEHLFPRTAVTTWEEIPMTGPRGFPILLSAGAHMLPFDAAELARAAKKLPGGKAPGPDFVHNEVLRVFAREDPEALLALYNLCWGASVFPARWKRAKLVLLYKGGSRPPAEPGSYRPISLIDTTAKLFERLILHRLEAEMAERGDLSIKQFGFRNGVGTVDAINRVLEIAKMDQGYRERSACSVVSLDVQNAINTASWPAIDEALRKKSISRRMVTTIRSYMSEREIQVPTEGEGWRN